MFVSTKIVRRLYLRCSVVRYAKLIRFCPDWGGVVDHYLCQSVQVRLVEDDLMYSTFGEVYEINCARYGREADLPITHFKERLNQAINGQLSPEAIVDLRLHTYNEITNKFVSENVFSQFMYKTLPTCNHLWTFKKQFAVQLALSGFMSYMLQIGGRSPNKILFAKNTGKVFQNDFHPGKSYLTPSSF